MQRCLYKISKEQKNQEPITVKQMSGHKNDRACRRLHFLPKSLFGLILHYKAMLLSERWILRFNFLLAFMLLLPRTMTFCKERCFTKITVILFLEQHRKVSSIVKNWRSIRKIMKGLNIKRPQTSRGAFSLAHATMKHIQL